MRLFYATLLVLLGFTTTNAQILEPVKWSASYKKLSETEGEISIKAVIEDKWHLNSQTVKDPFLPQKFIFEKNTCFTKVGKVTEPKPHKDFFDDIMQAQARYFEKEVVFKQKITILCQEEFEIKVKADGQTCSDETGMCILTQADLKLKVKPAIGKGFSDGAETGEVEIEEVKTTVTVETDSKVISEPVKETAIKSPTGFLEPQKLSDEVIAGLGGECGGEVIEEEKSFWGIFIGGFLGGFLALLTPCVFPMIPLTVSFFTKKNEKRAKGIANASIYALSIIIIYTLLGFVVSKAFGAEALNQMSTNVWFNLAFFAIFIVFAISFFGVFEITLPSSFVNKVDAAGNKGGLIGIFFMAFTLSLVSFSCTGPIIGTLLVEAATGGSDAGPLMGMFGFSLALALPFALFAMFPGILQSLPKSGGWLNSVKITLGFVELALALKFLSNVDMAYHWGFLKRELFLAIWVTIFSLLGFYLLGKIKFKSDSDTKDTSITGLLLAVVTFSFVLYLIPGIWGAPLRLISGFPPPIFYSELKEGSKPCPEGFDCEHDYMAGLNKGTIDEKPIMLDFTGWGCTNCRRMEENVWVKPEVKNLLRDEYVLVSLYCDDKEKLAAPFKIGGKEATTEGEKWSYLQQLFYNNNAQPFYVLIDSKGNLLANPRGYTPDAAEYAAYLKEGLCRFEKSQE